MNRDLLGQTRMGEISRQFREEGAGAPWTSQLGFILIPLAAVGVAWVIYRIYNRPRTPLNTPFGMLAELCRAHGIEGSGRRLLEKVADRAELEQPACLMIGPGQFDRAVAAAAGKGRLPARDRAKLERIRQRIFAS